MKFSTKYLIIIFTTCTIILAFVLISNKILKEPSYSENDLHLIWIIDGKNYFIEKDTSTGTMATNPELTKRLDNPEESFTKRKQKGVYRIFCLGGSTTRGWPFHKKLSYPGLLALLLNDLLPQKKIEVINSGFMGMDSTCEVNIMKEIINYEPDLILAYEGRTDLWNMPLHGSVFRFIAKTQVWLLRNVYLYSHMRGKYYHRTFDHARKTRMILEEGFNYSENNCRNYLTKNLAAIHSVTKQSNCRLVLMTMSIQSEEIKKGFATLFNKCIAEFAKDNNIILIDINKGFKESSIPEDDLLIPFFVHPNYKGYMLLSKIICAELRRHDIIAPAKMWMLDKQKNDLYYFKKLEFTPEFADNIFNHQLLNLYKSVGRYDFAKRYSSKAKEYNDFFNSK